MRLFLMLILLALSVGFAQADNIADCNQSTDPDRQIKGCSNLIKSGALSRSDQAIAHNNRAFSYTRKGLHSRAIVDLNTAIRLNPKFSKSFTNRGVAYQRRGHYDRAISDYNQALKINPKDALALSNRGNAFRKKSQYTQAVSDYTAAIRLNPKLAEAHTNRGDAYKDARLYDKALIDYNRALALNPRSARARAHRGDVHKDQANYELAIADLTQAIALNSKYAAAYNIRGNVYRRMCRYDEALADFEMSVKFGSAKRIRFYQVFLKKRRYYSGKINGAFGPEMRDALLAFARAHKCKTRQVKQPLPRIRPSPPLYVGSITTNFSAGPQTDTSGN